MFGRTASKSTMVNAENALAGRAEPIPTAEFHHVTGRPLSGDVPQGMARVMFGLGCFWGAERLFWQLEGVWLTRVGYAGGYTPNPTYQEVCTGQTGHAEVVEVIYDPKVVSFSDLLRVFWENHDPTQGMRQGNDVGTQYRSVIFTYSPQDRAEAEASRKEYAARLAKAGFGPVTTEIADAPPFYHAEDYHQQYLAKNPGGYCGLRGTGVTCATGTGLAAG